MAAFNPNRVYLPKQMTAASLTTASAEVNAGRMVSLREAIWGSSRFLLVCSRTTPTTLTMRSCLNAASLASPSSLSAS